MSSFTSPIFWQLQDLVQSLNKKSLKGNVSEMNQLINLFGVDARIFQLACLVDEIEHLQGVSQGGAFVNQKDSIRIQVLAHELREACLQSNFSTIICQVFENSRKLKQHVAESAENQSPSAFIAEFLSSFCKTLKLSVQQQIAILLGLVNSEKTSISVGAAKSLVQIIPELVGGASGTGKLPVHTLHAVLHAMVSHSSFCEECPPKELETCFNALRSSHSSEFEGPESSELFALLENTPFAADRSAPADISPAITTIAADVISEVSNGEVLLDLGQMTSSSQGMFSQFLDECSGGKMMSAKAVANLVSGVARIKSTVPDELLSMLCSSYLKNFDGSFVNVDELSSNPAYTEWNLDVMIPDMKQHYGSLDWNEVALELDCPDFFLPDFRALEILLQVFLKVTGEPFPFKTVCSRVWKHPKGQLSFLRQLLIAPSELLSFDGYDKTVEEGASLGRLDPQLFPGLQVVESSTPHNDNKAWWSLSIVATLLQISCANHGAYREEVRMLMTRPLNMCPSLLLANLFQHCSQPYGGGISAEELENKKEVYNDAVSLSHNFSNPLWRDLVLFLMDKTFGLILLPNSPLVPLFQGLLPWMWQCNPGLVCGFVIESFNKNQRVELLQSIYQLSTDGRTEMSSLGKSRAEYENGIMNRLIQYKSLPFSVALEAHLADRNPNSAPPIDVWINEFIAWAVHRLQNAAQETEGKTPEKDADEKKNESLDNAVDIIAMIVVLCMFFIKRHHANTVPRDGKCNVVLSEENLGLLIRTLPVQLNKAMVELNKIRSEDGSLKKRDKIALCEQVNSELKRLHEEVCKSHPQVMHEAMKSEVESEANAFFHRIYSSEQPIEEVVEEMQTLKNSSDSKETQVFMCMINNLFEEFSSFGTFRDNHLRITGELFGAIIQHSLVVDDTLVVALQCVLQALQDEKAANGKMFQFGLHAIGRFKGRLKEWPQFCSHVLNMPHVKSSQPELHREILMALEGARGDLRVAAGGSTSPILTNSSTPSLMQGSNPGTPNPNDINIQDMQSRMKAMELGNGPADNAALSRSVSAPGALPHLSAQQGDALPSQSYFGSTVALDALLKEEKVVETPPETFSDHVHRIMNNVSLSTVDSKAVELGQILKPSYFRWFSNYLVLKRITTQPNFHAVFVALLEGLHQTQLFKDVLMYTYINSHKLLLSDKITTSSQERSLLKNLGFWLGKLTVARNKAILHKHLDLKELLLSGFESGRLCAVVPFVCKILDGCKNSKIFKARNPWVMGLLSALKELYDISDLKTFIKFEVEVLAKQTFKLKIEDIQAGSYCPRRRQPNKENNPDFNVPVKMNAVPTPSLPKKTENGSVISDDVAGLPQGFSEGTVIPDLALYVSINASLTLFQQHPSLKRVVPVAVDRAIRDIIQPVVERSVKIACITSRELVMKDFAAEPDEGKIRKAAHNMVSSLAGSLALVTCKEPLRVSMSNNLRSLLSHTQSVDSTIIDQTVQMCASENLELGCMLIEKAATEKAMRDVDEDLNPLLSRRRQLVEQTGQSLYEILLQNGSHFALPEPLRPKPGSQNSHFALYDAFSRFPRPQARQQAPAQNLQVGGREPTVGGLPGAVPSQQVPQLPPTATQPPAQGAPAQTQTVTKALAMERMTVLIGNVDKIVAAVRHGQIREVLLKNLPTNHVFFKEVGNIRALIKMVPVEGAQREEVCLSFGQKMFSRLMEIQHMFSLEVIVVLLERLHEGCPQLNKELTAWLCANLNPEERKFRSIIPALIRSKLMVVADFDNRLCQAMNRGTNIFGIELALTIVRQCVVSENCVSAAELPMTLKVLLNDVLQRQSSSNKMAAIAKLLEEVNSLATQNQDANDSEASTGEGGTGKKKALPGNRSAADPPGSRERCFQLLEHWIKIYGGVESQHLNFVSQLQQIQVFNSEESQECFFRICMELCLEHCVGNAPLGAGANANNQGNRANGNGAGDLVYNVVDAFSKLVVLLVKHADRLNASKITFLKNVLSVVYHVLVRDLEVRRKYKLQFDQRVYYRFFANLIQELSFPDPALDTSNFQVLHVFGELLHMLQPVNVPAFSFAWLSLISHRKLMPSLLNGKNQNQGWQVFMNLLVGLFQFLGIFLRAPPRTDIASGSLRNLFKGTLRVMLVLLHDFPEFVYSNHVAFCDVIPTSCIQLRNLVLSACPRNARLPDPFTPNLKVDLLPDIAHIPQVVNHHMHALTSSGLLPEMDAYLRQLRNDASTIPNNSSNLVPQALLHEIRKKLLLSPEQQHQVGTKYNVPLLNALVLYFGMQAIQLLQKKSSTGTQYYLDLYLQMTNMLDAEGNYLFLNALANQLRYPNKHTHYFSCVLLCLFTETTQVSLKEQIARVLLERLIVNRPHPWGLLITFIELIKNPMYNILEYEFVRCAPDIERLFENVARSCTPHSEHQEQKNQK